MRLETEGNQREGLAKLATLPRRGSYMKVMYWLNENLEPVMMNFCYASMTILVFLQVVLRFGFENQISWGSSVAIYMFIWVAWMGASYNVRKRSHLNFGVIRGSLPYKAQFVCLLMDAFLWVSMSVVVIYFSIPQIQTLKDNFAFVPGSFDMMQWWFYTIGPIGWGLIIFRALQNLWEDIRTFQRGESFVLSGGAICEQAEG